MLTVKNGTIKNGNAKIVVGYDLGNRFSQISYYNINSPEPETVSSVIGTQMYNIPTILAKRPGVGQWFYGKEAERYVKTEGILVDNLLKRAERGEEVRVEDESYDPVALLALFMKRSLSLLSMTLSLKDIDGFIITVPKLTSKTVEVLSRVVAALSLKCEYITYQSHVESFYSYMIHQSKELWQYQVLSLEFNESLSSMRMECSHHTTPKVVFIHEDKYEEIVRPEWSEDENVLAGQAEELDYSFKRLCENILDEGDITTIYLLGDTFKDNWSKESLKVLCKNRRVFQGNNLYSKGACYSIMDKLNPNELSKSHVYLGEEKVKSNIGLKALRRGEDSYLAVIDAGSNWFEVKKDFDIILDEGNIITFLVTSLTGGKIIEKPIILEDLPERPYATTRLRIHIEMDAVDRVVMNIEDIGFGEIFKASGKTWSQVIDI